LDGAGQDVVGTARELAAREAKAKHHSKQIGLSDNFSSIALGNGFGPFESLIRRFPGFKSTAGGNSGIHDGQRVGCDLIDRQVAAFIRGLCWGPRTAGPSWQNARLSAVSLHAAREEPHPLLRVSARRNYPRSPLRRSNSNVAARACDCAI
jgi:hypothetical protein